MALEVLVSCMNQNDLSILKKLNLTSNTLIINQCDKNSYIEEVIDNMRVKMISTNQRGLTKSRNLALANASAEICIICDDDVEYYKDYEKTILTAFEKLPDADIIVFDIERINIRGNFKTVTKVRKSPCYKAYGSVRIAFRLKSIQQNNIWFNVNFGSGSKYSSGEESILLREAHRKKLNVYEYPAKIAKVDFSESTWREGYSEKLYYDKGALVAAAYPNLKYLFVFYFFIIFKKSSPTSASSILKWLFRGMRGYKNLLTYENFVNQMWD